MDVKELPSYCNDLLGRWRKHVSRPADVLSGRKGTVVVGAGHAGKALVTALQVSNIPVLAISDNDARKWDSWILETPVLSPHEAVARFGQTAMFIVAIGRLGERIKGLLDQFKELGAQAVLPFVEVIGALPAIWPHFFLNPNALSERDVPRIVAAFNLMCDEKTRDLYCSHLAWRITLDPAFLSIPTYDDQYFSRDIVRLSDCGVFVDVGAYSGDTLAELTRFSGGKFVEYHGFEPDANTYRRLRSRVDEITGSVTGHMYTQNVAIGANEKNIAFSSDGTPSSRSGTGDSCVRCRTLDSFGITNATFIKVDVEGFEEEVLTGAVHTLSSAKPIVAIATYHRPGDIFEIPLKLAEICPEYRFHLRSHGDAGTELDCYAVNR
jgi:FkbM family methyltransferase